MSRQLYNEEPEDAGTFVPIVARKLPENETTTKTVQERQRSSTSSEHVVHWPTRGDTPINEFSTEGYVSGAFPTLFPTGAGDYITSYHHYVRIMIVPISMNR